MISENDLNQGIAAANRLQAQSLRIRLAANGRLLRGVRVSKWGIAGLGKKQHGQAIRAFRWLGLKPEHLVNRTKLKNHLRAALEALSKSG